MPNYVKIADDEEILEIVREVQMEWHPDLQDAVIKVLWRIDISLSKGRRALGAARKATVFESLFTGEELNFVIWFCRASWRLLTDEQRRALVDHELSHCKMDGDKPYMVDHDITEFIAVWERHGFYLDSAERLLEALRPHLAFYEEAGESGQGGSSGYEERDVLDQVDDLVEGKGSDD